MSYAKLYFGRANAKLIKLEKITGKKVYTFSTMSGHNCPYAKQCKSKAVLNDEGKWRIQDGPDTVFRCFSASQEVLFPNVRAQRIENGILIETAARSIDDAVNLLQKNMPVGDNYIIRINVGGDFPTQNYFDAWIEVAKANSNVIFYAYTKSLPFWVRRLNSIPSNFILTASYGGTRDELIGEYNLRSAIVVENEEEANKLGLEIDHDDSIAISNGPSFALLIHGPMPKGSKFSKSAKKNGYNRRKNKLVTQ